MTLVAPKETRLVARVSQDVQELIKHAADMSGATLSQFIVEAATAKANTIVEQTRAIRLTLEGANRVFDALENPPNPNTELLAAAKKFKDHGGFYNENEGSNS